MLEITECNDLDIVFPGEFNERKSESREVTLQVIHKKKYKIHFKEEIIKILKDAIKDMSETKSEFNHEFNEVRNQIAEVCPGLLHLSLEQELEMLEDGGADWLKSQISQVIDSIVDEFSTDIEVKDK